MRTEMKARRTNDPRRVDQADQHNSSNPFCAAHPDLSKHAPCTAQSDPEDAAISLRRGTPDLPRVHPRADAVMVAKRRK